MIRKIVIIIVIVTYTTESLWIRGSKTKKVINVVGLVNNGGYNAIDFLQSIFQVFLLYSYKMQHVSANRKLSKQSLIILKV